MRSEYHEGLNSDQAVQISTCRLSRDVVLEASASARGGLEAVFLAGSASPRPHAVLPRS